MAQIVDFEQDPNAPVGTGNFRDADGRIMYLHDPDTASDFIKTMRGSSTAIARDTMGASAPVASPDLRLASNDPTAVALPNSAPPSSSEAAALQPTADELALLKPMTPPSAPAAPAAGPDSAPLDKIRAFANVPSGFPGATAPAAPATPAAPPPLASASRGPGSAELDKIRAFANLPKPGEAPRPAAPAAPPMAPTTTTPDKKGFLSDVTQSSNTTTTGGRSLANVNAQINSEEQAGSITDKYLREQAQKTDERAAQAIGTEKQQQDAIAERNKNRVIDEQIKQQAAEEKVDALKKQLADNDKSEDPNRLVKNMSTGKSVLMTILAAINGGFGALIGQKSNGVIDALNRAQEQDISKQKDEIARGHVRIGNDIARYMADGHDAKTAEALARDRSDAATDQVMALEAKRQGITGAQLDQVNALIAQRAEERAKRRGDLIAQTEARTQTTGQDVLHQQEKTGTGTTEEALKTVQLQNAILDQQDAAQVSKIVGKNLSPDRVKELKNTIKEVGSGVAETGGAVDMTQNLIDTLGGKLDETTGKIDWSAADGDLKGAGPLDARGGLTAMIPGAGELHSLGLFRTDNDKALAAQRALKEYVTKNLTGATASPEQSRTFGEMVGGNLQNEAEVKQNLQNWADTLFAIRNGQLSRLGPEGQKLLNYNAAAAKAGAGAPPLMER